MPVRSYADVSRRRDNDEYSFTTRNGSSRDYGRQRRFGGEGYDRVMSQISSPLRLDQLDPRPPSRRLSPYGDSPTNGEQLRDERTTSSSRRNPYGRHALAYADDMDDDQSEYMLPAQQSRFKQHYERPADGRRNVLNTSVRHALTYMDDLEDDQSDYMLPPQPSRFQQQYERPVDGRRNLLSTPARHALTYMDDLEDNQSEYTLPPQPSRFRPQRETVLTPLQARGARYCPEDWEEEIVAIAPSQKRVMSSQYVTRSESPAADYVQKEQEMQNKKMRKEVMDYVMPVTKRKPDPVLGEQEEAIRETASYVAMRNQYPVELPDRRDLFSTDKYPRYQYRTRGLAALDDLPNPIRANRSREDLHQSPMFIMKLRSHVVWEKMYVKFTCTIRGSPPPKVTWYHDMVPIEPMLMEPGTVKISNQYGVYTLEIFKTTLADSGTYRISAQNYKGEISSYATLLVRRYDGTKSGYYDVKSGYNLRKPTDYPDVEHLNVPGYPRFVSRLFNKKVQEGGAVVLTCEVAGSPSPEAFWTLNGRHVDTKVNHVQIDFDGKLASLTILKAYTDDEGEYVCRAYNSCGAATSKCFLTVSGANAPPSAPTDLQCSDVTRNHIMLSWKQAGYQGHFGGAPIDGYLIEKAEVGSSVWRMASKKPVKLTTSPVTCLNEGSAYFFRVRAFNRWGRGPASIPVGPIAMRDPGTPRLDLELMDLVSPETDEILVEEEEPDDVPGIPTNVEATVSKDGDCVFVRWTSPESEDADGFHIEYCEDDADDNWRRVTKDSLQSSDPYPVMDLPRGKPLKFRVLGVNAAGAGEPSDVTSAVFLTCDGASGIVDSNEKSQMTLQDLDCEQTPADREQTFEDCDQTFEDCEQTFEDCEQTIAEQSPEMSHVYQETNERYRGPPTPPREVQFLKATREYIEIGWIPPSRSGGEQVRYYIEYRNLADDDWSAANHSPVRYTQYPVEGLEPGERYIFRVRAVTSAGTSPFSEPSEAVLASDGIKPPNWWGGVRSLFRVADDHGKPCVTEKSVKLCWDPPRSDGGSNVTGYFLEYRPCGGKFKPINNKALTQRHFTVDDLTPGVFYEFRLKACNVSGCGEWKKLPGKVQAKEPDRPNDPSDVMIANVTEESVDLTWNKPGKMGDGDFVGYVVERRKEDSENWIPCNKLPEQIQDEKYKVAGLIKGQTYFFRVTAVNQVGEGIASLQSCFVTPGEALDDVTDRQEAVKELARKKREAEEERLRLLQEVERKEAFLTKIEDCYTTVGGQAYFECKVKDHKTEVAWFLGNWKEIPIAPEGKYDIVSVGKRRTLVINDCQADDVQAVHCVALYNGCTCEADLVVGEMEPLHFIRTPDDVFIKNGERAIFCCVFTKPHVKVTWYKNDVPVTLDDDVRYEFVEQGGARSLIIADVTSDDIAMYRISGLGGSYTANLVVDGVLPVKFNEKLSDCALPYDATIATFECLAEPSQLFEGRIPPCQWYHGNELIDVGDDKYEIISDGNRHILKVLNPTFEDNGEITCVVAGGKTICHLQVEKPPPPPPKPVQTEDYIINFEQSMRAQPLPNALRLFCIVTKLTDDAQIIWYHNNCEIEIDNDKFKCFNDRDTGLVSLVISPISRDLMVGKFTCEFITPLSTFDTKVNLEFDDNEFKKLSEKAGQLLQEEERERRERQEERKRQKEERLKKAVCDVVEPKSNTTSALDQKIPECTSLEFDVTNDGSILIFSKTSFSADDGDVTWLKDDVMADDERYQARIENDKAVLEIKNPCADDAGMYMCRIKSDQSKTEASADVTGKVFKQLLLQSADIRISGEADDCQEIATEHEDCDEAEARSDTSAEVAECVEETVQQVSEQLERDGTESTQGSDE